MIQGKKAEKWHSSSWGSGTKAGDYTYNTAYIRSP